MRTLPASVDSPASLMIQDVTGATFTTSAIAIDTSLYDFNKVTVNATISGGTSGRFASLQNNNSTSGYIGFSAEL